MSGGDDSDLLAGHPDAPAARMRRAGARPILWLGSIALLVLVVLLLAGSGAGGTRSDGRHVFLTAGCAGCHTLAAAGSHAIVGPDLDAASPGYALVLRQVLTGGNGMPSFRHTLSTGDARAVALYVSTVSRHSANYLAFKPTGQALSTCAAENFGCLSQAFGNLAYADGPRAALERLQAMSTDNQFVGRFCHQIAHIIGHAAYARFRGDAAKALSLGSMTCGSGYYHGVVERAFAGEPRSEIPGTAAHLCSSLENSSLFVLYQCVHGLGHGLMIYSGDDLPYALQICDGLPSLWDRQSCDGGAFMQNFLTGPTAMVSTSWLRSNDLLFPCDAVAIRDRYYCYLQVTDRILPAVGYRWIAAIRWCQQAPAAWEGTCFQSLGRDASGFENHAILRVLAVCDRAGAHAGDCVYGAARDMANNAASGKAAARLCEVAGASVRGQCFSGVGSIIGALDLGRTARINGCNEVTPSRYRSACYDGAAIGVADVSSK